MIRFAVTSALGACLLASACGDNLERADASTPDGPFDLTADADMPSMDAITRDPGDAGDHPSGEADVPVDASATETPAIDSPAIDRDGPSQDAQVSPAECRVGRAPETPHTVQFEIRGAGRELELAVHCSPFPTTYVEITSCSSGYREQLGNVVGCRCACPYTGCVEKSPCVPCENTSFRSFGSSTITYSTWIAARSRVDGPGGPTCDKGIPLPTGLYRITLKVRLSGREEQLVSQIFELPAPGNMVRIDLGNYVGRDAGTVPEAGM